MVIDKCQTTKLAFRSMVDTKTPPLFTFHLFPIDNLLLLQSLYYTFLDIVCPNMRSRKIKFRLLTPLPPSTLLTFELLLLAFATGVQDAVSFPDYRCFASNQTGNTVLFAVGALDLKPSLFAIPNIACSLALFVTGVLVTAHAGNFAGSNTRWYLILQNLLQTILVFIAAAIQYILPIEETGPAALGVIALLALSAGMQVGTVRALKITDITTAMATAAFVDLFLDPKLLVWSAGKETRRGRKRRLGFLLALVVGSFVGAVAYKFAGSPTALVVSAVGKLVVTVMLWFNKAEDCHEGAIETKV